MPSAARQRGGRLTGSVGRVPSVAYSSGVAHLDRSGRGRGPAEFTRPASCGGLSLRVGVREGELRGQGLAASAFLGLPRRDGSDGSGQPPASIQFKTSSLLHDLFPPTRTPRGKTPALAIFQTCDSLLRMRPATSATL